MAIPSPEIIRQNKNVPFNFVVNVIDGGFFGLGLGFASLTTVVALFVSNMTDSAVLIGLIPAIHVMGWQLPQIFTAHRVAQQKRFKPMAMFFTIHERLPFLGLAIVSWFIPHIGPKIALVTTFLLLIWQGFGGGFTANAWQNMIAKIIPRERWGVFFGIQSAAGNMLAAIGVGIAGVVLQSTENNRGFTICFLLAVGAFIVSYIALMITREEASTPVTTGTTPSQFWQDVRGILVRDRNFRWFVTARILGQLGTVGFSFYTVYVVRFYGINEATAGILAGVSMASQTLFNPIMGWLGDRWSHRGVMAIGMAAAAMSAIIARWAPSVGWFYLAYALAGIAYVATWTIALAMSLEFGKDHEKPAYIGMANTFIAPTAFLIPILAGWLADKIGYGSTFMATAVGALLTVGVLSFILQDQKKNKVLPE